MNVRLTQLDGKLPNLALMKLAAWHRAKGDDVTLTRNARRGLFEPAYDRVYGSAIFTRSMPLVGHLRADFPDAIVGGTGTADWTTVEQTLGVDSFEQHDFSIYPDFPHSIGFTQRGCRLACGFCVVPRKEGRPRTTATIADIWRGEPHPKNVILLDNDFFGQPRAEWEARIDELQRGNFRVSFNQGINVRLIDGEAAHAIASVRYYDDNFKERTLYTAFDNVKDERIFRRGIDNLLAAGIRARAILVYMLIGYDPAETWEAIFLRFNIMLEYGLRPYPMVYERVGEARAANGLEYTELKQFQRWVIRRYYKVVPWWDFRTISESEREALHRSNAVRAAGPSLFEV